MRYLVGFVFVLAVAGSSLSVSAQDGDVAAASQHAPEESTLSDEPVDDEGTLSPRVRKRTGQQWDPDTYELRLDSSGLNLSPPPARPQKTDARLRQYRQGVIVSGLVVGIGGALIGVGVVTLRNWQEEESQDPSLDSGIFPPGGTIVLFTFGTVAVLGGLIGAAVCGSKLSARKQALRGLQAAHRRNPPRVRWDLERSALVF